MKVTILLPILLLASCIGTDKLDDPIIGESLRISQSSVQLLINQNEQLIVDYKDQYGVPQEINALWVSENESIASVDVNGIVKGISPGQTLIFSSFNDVTSNAVLITVVENSNSIARISIIDPLLGSVEIGDSLKFMAEAFNINDDLIPDIAFSWSVDNSKAIIDSAGLLIAQTDGLVMVRAQSSGISSLPYELVIGNNEKVASFSGSSGYNAEGTATLSKNSSGELILTLQSDFQADVALGTFIYLANSTSGSVVKSTGLELGSHSSGFKEFNISSLDPNADLDTYRYVIVLCKPASITFGFADFQM